MIYVYVWNDNSTEFPYRNTVHVTFFLVITALDMYIYHCINKDWRLPRQISIYHIS